MKIGLCCSPEFAPKAQKGGFDYWEVYLAKIAPRSNAEFAENVRMTKEMGFYAEAGNGFFNNDIHRLTGESVNMPVLLDHAKLVLSRGKELGMKVAVVGSGSARAVPEGFSAETAYKQFDELLWNLGVIAADYDITLAIEPLRRKETNLINTVADGLAAVKRVNHPNVTVLADLFHVMDNGESFDAIRGAGKLLTHVHVANPDGRNIPATTDKYDYREFKAALDACGYNARMSMEGGFNGEEFPARGVDAVKAVEYFR